MAFSLYASTGDTTTQLNDGLPFRFENVDGLSGGGVTRHEQSGPSQNGVTDLGYRLQPRIITLSLIFTAADDATLDAYRDTLMEAFAPLGSISTFLSVQRDDDEIRTLTCHRVGEIDITIAPELRPGHTHRATLQLRAANPLWKANAVTSGSATFTGLTSWWTAGGAMSPEITVENSTQNNVVLMNTTYTGDWSVAVVTTKDTAGITEAYAWTDAGSVSFFRGALGSVYYKYFDTDIGRAWQGTDDYNLHVVESRSGTQYWRYWNGSGFTVGSAANYDMSLTGIPSGFRWRGDGGAAVWEPQIRKGAVYSGVTLDQLTALAPYMLNTLQGSVTLVNDGDVNAYPVISLRGPIVDPIITNQTTGETIDLTGGTILDGATWTIDLRDGNRRIYDQDGNNVLGSVTTLPISMAGFAVAPSPTASGGTNVIVMTPGSVGGSAVFNVQITNQYLSF